MADNHEYISISSDSSSDSESTENRMPPPPYLPPYRPPGRGWRTKEEARRFKNDINAKYLPWHRRYKSPQAAQPAPSTHSSPPSQPSSPPVQPNPYYFPAQKYSAEEYMPKPFLKTLSTHLAKFQSKPSWEETKSPPSEASSESPTSPAAIPPSQIQVSQSEGSSKPSGVVMGLACKKVWNVATASIGKKRTMPDTQVLIETFSRAAQEKEKRESKASGKRPMK